MEKLRLERSGSLVDLVQEDGAVAGCREVPDAIAVRSRERPLLVTEQLGLEQVLRDRAAVDRGERLVHPRPGVVNDPRDGALARARLAFEHDRLIDVSEVPGQFEDVEHCGGGGDEGVPAPGRHDGRSRHQPSVDCAQTTHGTEPGIDGASRLPMGDGSSCRI